MRDGWVIKHLDEVCTKFGAGPFGSNMKVSTFVDTGIPVISGNHMTELELVEKSFNYITEDHANRMQSSIVQRSDVVITKAGTIGQVSLIPENSRFLKYVLSSRQLFARPNRERVLPKYLAIYLKYGRGQDQILSNVNRTGVPSLSQAVSFIKNVQIELPPLPEQKRIVDLISSVDSYTEALQQQLESAKRSRNAVLHELLTAGGGDWVETTLGEIANWGSGGTPKADNPAFYDGEIPWCVIGDLTESEVWDTEKKITNLGLTNSSAKVIDPGSVLLAMYGASIGRTGISAIPMATNQAIAFARCHPNLALPKYLLAYLQTQKTKFVEMGQGAAQPNISQTIIKSWPIDLPPIPYQNHLVSTMEVFDATLFTLQSSIHSSKLLRSSLLSDLLSGEHEIPSSYDKVIGAA